MKMSKLRRKNAALNASLAKSREVWKADQAALRLLRDKHRLITVPALYGRRGATEARCALCTSSSYPCATWKALDDLLQRRAA